MKPVLYRIISKDVTTSESLHKRNLSWFDDNLIVCCLYNNNNWMGKFLTKHLEEIKREAKLKGFRFFWTEDPNMEEFMDLSIVNNPRRIIQEEIEHYLFNDQGGRRGLFRRVDDDHFIGWDYIDMVKSSIDIAFPKDLYEKLGLVDEYGSPVDLFQSYVPNDSEETDETSTDFSPDPENHEHDHYFHQFSCQCEKCSTVEFYKIPEEFDFYGIMESEARCARCGKESWVISSGGIGYYLSSEYDSWHPCCVEIPSGTGYCEECKPYYVSNVENLEFRCNCGGIMRREV